MDSRNPRLSGVEALRGIAATAVILYHVARHLSLVTTTPFTIRVWQFGHAGVDLFFVISGFIIMFIHYRDIDEPSRAPHYLNRRLTRVMPIYWVALAVTVVGAMAAGHAFPSTRRLMWSIALLPSNDPPLLGIAWTLQYELVFYAAFATLILSRSSGCIVFALWFVFIVVSWIIGGAGDSLTAIGVPSSLYSPFNLEFLAGMTAAYILRRLRLPVPRMTLVIGIILFSVAGLAESLGYMNGYAASARLFYGVPSALLVLGVVEAERSDRLRVPNALRLLGATSYSIYLFQFVFIGLAWKCWLATGLETQRFIGPVYLLLACAGVGGGVAAGRLLEQPLLRFVRSERVPVARRARVGAP